jgi:hypothetical protein
MLETSLREIDLLLSAGWVGHACTGVPSGAVGVVALLLEKKTVGTGRFWKFGALLEEFYCLCLFAFTILFHT